MATNLGGKARPRSLAVQRRKEVERQQALEVQRAQAEERRQRLEEEKHELELQKYAMEEKRFDLEKAKIYIDALKHVVTVITALLFILAYFGDRVIPALEAISFLKIDVWRWVVVGLLCRLFFHSLG